MKYLVKSIFHRFGLDISRSVPSSSATSQIIAALNYVNVNLIFDIGSNIGQFSRQLRLFGFKGDIVSFEPLSKAHAQLSAVARFDPLWKVHPRVGLGNYDGETNINISANSVSSSILNMLDAHSSASASSSYVGSESVPVRRLDSIASLYLLPSHNLFLKIDTQGFESQVLQGSSNTLKLACGVLLELSIIPLYEGQDLWLALIEFMELKGFTVWSIQP